MTQTLTIVGAVASRAFRVLWLAEELGLDYTHIDAGPRSPEATQYNPTGKIPAAVVGETVLTDSVAIMTYLADAHGAFTYPAGTLERARQDAHLHFVLEDMDAVLWTAAKHSFILPEDQRVPAIKPVLARAFSQSVDALAARIEGEFLMGDTMTIADILAVHCLNWSVSAKMAVPNEAVDAYAKRLRARPAFKAVRALANT